MQIIATSAALSPLILGLVQVGLQIGLPKKFSPVLSVILGVLAGIFYLDPGNYPMAVLVGVSLGLSAVGLHSGVKNVKEGIVSGASSKSVAAGTLQSNTLSAPNGAGDVKTATAANPEQPTAPAQPQNQQPAQQGVNTNATS